MTADYKSHISETIKKMAEYMNFDCRVEIKDQEENKNIVLAAVYTDESARLLIGKNGQNLRAFEHVVRAMCLKSAEGLRGLVLDVNDYKKTRAGEIVEIARQAASRVRNNQKAEALTPMSAYERRLIHTELSIYPDIVTESVGEEPQRRVVIKPN